MPHKEFLLQKCTAMGFGYMGINIMINPNWISVLFSVIGSLIFAAYFLTVTHEKVKNSYKSNWNLWWREVIVDSFRFWIKSTYNGIKDLFKRNN